ncbi:hypothetical protein AAG906_019588 [Vitis piasezkii]
MPSLQDIESMMVGIDDLEEFKRVFLVFASNLIGTHISLWKVVTHYAMYVELTTPRIAAWNDFLVKQRIKLELEMLGGFGKVEATQCQITDAQSHLNSLIASYNRDMKVLRTRFTSSHYCTDEGQPSNFHEHVNESGVSERPNVEDGVFFSNEDPLHPRPHNMLVLVQSCMNNNVDTMNNVCKSPFVQLCVSKYKRLTEEETHVADYVFDESKDPSEMLYAYGGYGVTWEQLQCLVGESFIDIPEICGSMSKSTSKSTLKKRLGSYCVNLECCNQFYIPLFQFNEWVIMVINLEAKRVDLLSSYNSIQRLDLCRIIKNSFKRNDVNINNLHPQMRYRHDPKLLMSSGMYAILYMQHWDGSGLNKTINSLERLKFATHMVLDSENEIGEMVTANIWSTNDAE